MADKSCSVGLSIIAALIGLSVCQLSARAQAPVADTLSVKAGTRVEVRFRNDSTWYGGSVVRGAHCMLILPDSNVAEGTANTGRDYYVVYSFGHFRQIRVAHQSTRGREWVVLPEARRQELAKSCGP